MATARHAAHADGAVCAQSARELEVLLALCRAAPALQTPESAQKLLRQLSPYMIESPTQQFAPSPYLRLAEPSPWEALARGLAAAVLSLGLNFPLLLRAEAVATTNAYLRRVLAVYETAAADDDDAAVACAVASLAGFLDSCARMAAFWSPVERAVLVLHVRKILSPDFLARSTAAAAAIRIAPKKAPAAVGQWKRLAKRYETLGRPLGALLLQHGLMALLIACTSLLVTNSSSNNHMDAFCDGDVLDVLMRGRAIVSSIAPNEDIATIESLVDLAKNAVAAVDDAVFSDADAASLPLAYAVKAHALTVYCNCVVLSQAADPDALQRWLEATIADPAQMAHPVLAAAALKTLAILSRVIGSAHGFVSILHRFVVEGAPRRDTVRVAAKCLSYMLQHACSQDATITTLNTMGHVLSSATPERALRAETLQPFEHQAMASSLSLASSSSDDFRHSIYCNVIETIVVVASNCTDLKVRPRWFLIVEILTPPFFFFFFHFFLGFLADDFTRHLNPHPAHWQGQQCRARKDPGRSRLPGAHLVCLRLQIHLRGLRQDQLGCRLSG